MIAVVVISAAAFSGARERAQDRSAQSTLRTAISAMETQKSSQDYTDDAEALRRDEPSILWVADNSPTRDSNAVAVDAIDANGDGRSEKAVLGTWSRSGRCYYARLEDYGDQLGLEYATEPAAEPSSCSLSAANDSGNWTSGPESGSSRDHAPQSNGGWQN